MRLALWQSVPSIGNWEVVTKNERLVKVTFNEKSPNPLGSFKTYPGVSQSVNLSGQWVNDYHMAKKVMYLCYKPLVA